VTPPSTPSAAIAPFLTAIAALDTDAWKVVLDTAVSTYPAHSAAVKSLAFSASESSWVRKAVKDALLPNAPTIQAVGAGAFSRSTSASDSAALALIDHGALSPEEREVLLAPFAAAGVPSTAFELGAA
jgi:hypothetical protein